MDFYLALLPTTLTWASSVPPDENSSELARTYKFRALFIYRFCKGSGNRTKLYPQYP